MKPTERGLPKLALHFQSFHASNPYDIILKSTSFHGQATYPRSFTCEPVPPGFFHPKRKVSPTECRRSAKKSKWATRNGRLGMNLFTFEGSSLKDMVTWPNLFRLGELLAWDQGGCSTKNLDRCQFGSRNQVKDNSNSWRSMRRVCLPVWVVHWC